MQDHHDLRIDYILCCSASSMKLVKGRCALFNGPAFHLIASIVLTTSLGMGQTVVLCEPRDVLEYLQMAKKYEVNDQLSDGET